MARFGDHDRFGTHKILTLQWATDHEPGDLSRYGEVLEAEAPKSRVRCRAKRCRKFWRRFWPAIQWKI